MPAVPLRLHAAALVLASASSAFAQCAVNNAAVYVDFPCTVAQGQWCYLRSISPAGSISNLWSGTPCSPVGGNGYDVCCQAGADGRIRATVTATLNSTTRPPGIWTVELVVSDYAANTMPAGTVLWSMAYQRVNTASACADITAPTFAASCYTLADGPFTYDPSSIPADALGWRWTGTSPFNDDTWTYESTDVLSGSTIPPELPPGEWIVTLDLMLDVGGDLVSPMTLATFCAGETATGSTQDLPDGTGDPDQPVTGGDTQLWLDALADRLEASNAAQTDALSGALDDQTSALASRLDAIAANTAATSSAVDGLRSDFGDFAAPPDVAAISAEYPLRNLGTASPLAVTVPGLPTGGTPLSLGLDVDVLGNRVPVDFGWLGNSLATIDGPWRPLIRAWIAFAAWVAFISSILRMGTGA